MELSARQVRFLERVVACIESEPVNTPGVPEIARSLGVPIQAVQEIVRIGCLQKTILSLDGVLFTPAQIDRVQTRVREMGRGALAPKQMREELSTTRRYLDALLAYFDRTGFTRVTREGRVVADPESRQSDRANI